MLAIVTIGDARGAWAQNFDTPGPGMPPAEDSLARMTRVLGLSDFQLTAIKAIFVEEREKNKALMELMAGYRKQRYATGRTETFDEEAVRAIASEMVQVEVELQNKIYALLTAEQRALEDKLRPSMKSALGGDI
jgi:Spy/CpxP family protein refolding chaperone